jgi:hypothetical protein
MIQKDPGSRHPKYHRRWKRWLKWFSKRKDRAALREALGRGNFDNIPKQGPIKTEDPWGWD